MDEDDADEDEEEEEEDFSDDDDMSWKVRRAAAKCCSALISQYIDELALMYQKLVPLLLKRFNEREESVRLEVFDTFEVLLRQTSSASHESAPERLLKPINSQIIKAAAKQLRCVAMSSMPLSSSGLFNFLMQRQGGKSAQKRMYFRVRQKCIKTRVGIFSVMKNLTQCLPGSLEGSLETIVPNVVKTLQERSTSSGLKIEVLNFLKKLLETHSAPQEFEQFLPAVFSPVFSASGDKYYKVRCSFIAFHSRSLF